MWKLFYFKGGALFYSGPVTTFSFFFSALYNGGAGSSFFFSFFLVVQFPSWPVLDEIASIAIYNLKCCRSVFSAYSIGKTRKERRTQPNYKSKGRSNGRLTQQRLEMVLDAVWNVCRVHRLGDFACAVAGLYCTALYCHAEIGSCHKCVRVSLTLTSKKNWSICMDPFWWRYNVLNCDIVPKKTT